MAIVSAGFFLALKIAYAEDRNATTTCDHLKAIEQAMRSAGIYVRMRNMGDITAQCRIDDVAMRHAFNSSPVVRYAEFFISDRCPDDIPAAFLICDEHKSIILTFHPAETYADRSPLFPS